MSLKLRAEDAEDLKVMSAHMQDALIRVGDIAFLPRKRRLALSLNRFCWERPPGRVSGKDAFERTNAGFHVEDVSSVKTRGMNRDDSEALLYLLAIVSRIEADGAGEIELQFAGGASLVARVECVDAELVDLGESWLTDMRPEHNGTAASQP